MYLLFLGLLLGMGASIPIGPVNLEIIRRNLRFGTPYGMVTGFGACAADLFYLILLCLGALTLLQYPVILNSLGFIGSFILAWFGFSALRAKIKEMPDRNSMPSLLRYGIEGFAITLVNPYTILFWISVSSQISTVATMSSYAIYLAGAGVILGTFIWVLTINTILHFTRHKLSTHAIKWLNYLGGIILLIFALLGLVHVVWNLL